MARTKHGPVALNDRMFGVEIECLAPGSRSEIAQALNEAGVDAVNESYNHFTVSHWKVITDSSIVNAYIGRQLNCMELVSPRLLGEDGLNELRLVYDVLNNEDVEVNHSCGLHVHHDVTNMSVSQVKKLAKLFCAFEEPIFRTASPNRQKNSYCRRSIGHSWSNMSAFEKELRQWNTLREIQYGWYDRQGAINLQNVHTRGSVEFRLHDATLDWDEVVHWLAFTQSLVDTSSKIRYVPKPRKPELSKLFEVASVQEPVRTHLLEQVERYKFADMEPFPSGDAYDNEGYDDEEGDDYNVARWDDEDDIVEYLGPVVLRPDGRGFFTDCNCSSCRQLRSEQEV